MKIGIIGAGPAGLEALRLSLKDGHTCEAFEKTENIGGIWNYTDKTGKDEYGLQIQSSMYQGLKTNLPKELMQYEDFPYKKPKHSYVSYPEVMQYMNDFATTFNLLTHIKFLNYVERVSYLPNGKWSLEIKELKTQEKEQREFDAVFVCIGNVSSLSIPHIPGKENFNGSIIHSHDYRKPDSYKNKRVLVIGSGSSGKDVTKFVTNVAEKVILSHRSPLDSSFKLPPGVVTKPVVMEFKETSVLFADGSEEDIDAVVFCTGYLIDFPCLSPSCEIEVDNKWVKYLYKDIINVEHPTMAITGMLFPIFRFPLYGIQVAHHQQDGAHYAADVRRYLDQMFTNRWIRRRGHIEWPAKLPDLNPLNYFMWGNLKNVVYKTKLANIQKLKEIIRTEINNISQETMNKVQ